MNRFAALLLFSLTLASITLSAITSPSANADEPLKYVTSHQSAELDGVVSIDISNDGQHAYTAAYVGKTLGVFSRDAKTGLLTRIDAITDANLMNGMTAARLSPDNRFAITAAFNSDATILFTRDPKTGKLTMADSVKHGNNTQALLDFAIDAAWSPDSKYAYVIAPSSAAVNVFRITPKPGLEFVEAEQGTNRCFAGARGIAVSPDGQYVYVASEYAATLTVLEVIPNTGKLEVLEVHRDGETKVGTLKGAFSLAVSPDGKFVYLSSGRFRGSDAITIFKKKNDGTLELVEEMYNFTDKLQRFVGGNEITVSRDGKQVYAVASRSDSMVVMDRDPQTGKLKQTQFLVDQFRGVGAMLLPGGVTVSPDGKFIYVAAEGSDAITVFQKDLPKPAIAEKPPK